MRTDLPPTRELHELVIQHYQDPLDTPGHHLPETWATLTHRQVEELRLGEIDFWIENPDTFQGADREIGYVHYRLAASPMNQNGGFAVDATQFRALLARVNAINPNPSQHG